MKTTLGIAALLLFSGTAMADNTSLQQDPIKVFRSFSSTINAPAFEAAGRKGSKRVGGSGKSGKGGKYVGGRK